MLESVRRTLDPLQHRLIPAHVTLCREDELARWDYDTLHSRIGTIALKPVTLQFGRPEPFHEHGILLPCIAGDLEFNALRDQVLGSRSTRRQSPHITLAHPRNPKAPGNCLANAEVLPQRISITFSQVNVIEQKGMAPWRVLATFDITGAG